MQLKLSTAACYVLSAVLLLASSAAMAQVAGANWLSALGCTALNLQNAVRAFAFVAIIALGVLIMFMEVKGWIQDLMKILFGISIALFAATFLNSVFPNQGFSFSCL